MQVFNGSIQTARRVADPHTDHSIGGAGSLVLPAIGTSEGLLYPGADVALIHGNQHLRVDQNRSTLVGMNANSEIGMAETHLVNLGRTVTVMGPYARSVMSDSIIQVAGNYQKNIAQNYDKQILGDSANRISGNYSKSVQQNYEKTITGN
jgi:hypothetical protein